MNMFFDKFKHYKYVAKVDNDTVVSAGWLTKLKAVLDKFPLFTVEANHYLAMPFKIDTNDDFYRFGVPKDINSFIHCVLRSINHEDYMESENKGDFVVDFRTSLLNDIDVSIVAQEMYGVSFEKIEHSIDIAGWEQAFDPQGP